MFKIANMINLNLLPENLKKEIESKKILHFINKAIIISSVLLFIYLIAFNISKYILIKHYRETKEVFANTNHETESYINNMDIINKKINYIKDIQADYIIWSKLIYDISLTNNDGIIFESLSVNKDKKILNIRGKAKTREKLLLFKDKIQEVPYLSEIVFPLQNLFKKEDINFDINATIKTYDFRLKQKK